MREYAGMRTKKKRIHNIHGNSETIWPLFVMGFCIEFRHKYPKNILPLTANARIIIIVTKLLTIHNNHRAFFFCEFLALCIKYQTDFPR